MFKLKLKLNFILLMSFESGAIMASDRPKHLSFWQSFTKTSLIQKIGISVALVTGYEGFIPKDVPDLTTDLLLKPKDVDQSSSPVSVAGLFTQVVTKELKTAIKLKNKYRIKGVEMMPIVPEALEEVE